MIFMCQSKRKTSTFIYLLKLFEVFRFVAYFYLAPILNILVPQVGQVPLRAGFPFFMVTPTAFGSSFFARHLTQYMLAIFEVSPPLKGEFFYLASHRG